MVCLLYLAAAHTLLLLPIAVPPSVALTGKSDGWGGTRGGVRIGIQAGIKVNFKGDRVGCCKRVEVGQEQG